LTGWRNSSKTGLFCFRRSTEGRGGRLVGLACDGWLVEEVVDQLVRFGQLIQRAVAFLFLF